MRGACYLRYSSLKFIFHASGRSRNSMQTRMLLIVVNALASFVMLAWSCGHIFVCEIWRNAFYTLCSLAFLSFLTTTREHCRSSTYFHNNATELRVCLYGMLSARIECANNPQMCIRLQFVHTCETHITTCRHRHADAVYQLRGTCSAMVVKSFLAIMLRSVWRSLYCTRRTHSDL